MVELLTYCMLSFAASAPDLFDQIPKKKESFAIKIVIREWAVAIRKCTRRDTSPEEKAALRNYGICVEAMSIIVRWKQRRNATDVETKKIIDFCKTDFGGKLSD